MKKLNRVLSILLALSLCISVFSAASLAGAEEPMPAAGAEESFPPAPAAAGEEEDVSPEAFADRLVDKLKNHVLTNVNYTGTAAKPGKPGAYDKKYDAYIARLEAVIAACAAAYADEVGQETVNARYDELNHYNKTDSTHDKAIIALLSEVLAAGVDYTHTVTADGYGTGGRPISDGAETFYTYCSEDHFTYPVKGLGYRAAEPTDAVSGHAERLVRALEAGYPLDSYGLSRLYDEVITPGLGMGLSTQQVIWDILADKSVPTYSDAYSAALFTYATTDQVLERTDVATVTAQPEGPAVLTYDEAADRYTGSFTLAAGKYAEITAETLPENAEAYYALPAFPEGVRYPLTGDVALVPGSVVTLVADGEAQSVSGLRFSYVSFRRVGDTLASFLNYDVVYDGSHEVGLPFQTMIGFGMEAVMGALDVSVALTGKPGQEPERAAGVLTLEKVFAGAEAATPEGLTFTVESDSEGFAPRTLTLADFTLDGGVYTCTLEELPLGTYTFTEQNAGAAGYDLTAAYTVDGREADRAAAALTEEHTSAALRIINTYTAVSESGGEPPYVPPYRPPVTPTEPEPTPGPSLPPAGTPETPDVELEIPEEDVPLAGRPEQPPEPELPDEPAGEVIIVEEGTPLGGLPQTGSVDADAVAFRDGLMTFFVILSALSAAGLAVCIATRKRWN